MPEGTRYVIGFTGTRSGMTREQCRRIVALIQAAKKVAQHPVVGLHGDCLGADADFDRLCRDAGLETWCRPCNFPNMRAHTPAKVIAEPIKPMARNRDIIAHSSVLFACPPNDEEIKRGSGTWATIRYGRKRLRRTNDLNVYIVFPDGTLSAETVGE